MPLALLTRTTPRTLTPEPLNVTPALIGRPLARVRSRALAMAVDLLAVALISGASSHWLAVGLVTVAVLLRGRGLEDRRWHPAFGWGLVALFAGLAAPELMRPGAEVDTPPDRTTPAEGSDATRARPAATNTATQAATQAATETAAELRADGLRGAARMVERGFALPAGDGTASAPAAGPAASVPSSDLLQARITTLEAELAEARQPRAFRLRDELRRLADGLGATFGWGIVYFTLLPAFWNGQTLGKRLFGLRVVELTGQPMTVMRALRRYGGYAAGMATGGLGFAQALWDVNRQAIQDRTAHTVVLDERAAVAVAATPAAAPAPPPRKPVP